jgi:hypothetical protein
LIDKGLSAVGPLISERSVLLPPLAAAAANRRCHCAIVTELPERCSRQVVIVLMMYDSSELPFLIVSGRSHFPAGEAANENAK